MTDVRSPNEMQLLRVGDVAQRLGISRSLVYKLVESGKLLCYRIGAGRGAIRFSECDLQDFILQSRSQDRRIGEKAKRPTRRKLRHLRG
jgi:excisionase family DNA binding protein